MNVDKLRVGLTGDVSIPGSGPTTSTKVVVEGVSPQVNMSRTSYGGGSAIGTISYAEADTVDGVGWAFYGEGVVSSLQGQQGIAAELAAINRAKIPFNLTPYSNLDFRENPLSVGLWVSCGRPQYETFPSSAAIGICSVANRFQRGIVFMQGSLEPVDGALIAIHLPDVYRICWGRDGGAFITGSNVDWSAWLGNIKRFAVAEDGTWLWVGDKLRKIEVGPPDSDGHGYRRLRVAN